MTVLSDSARELLGLPDGSQGRRLADLDLAPSVRDALLGDSDVHDAVDGRGRTGRRAQPQPGAVRRAPGRHRDDPARPHRAARDGERAQRPRERDRDPARADPRVQQPAAHDLGAGPARGVRRGVAGHRHPHPAAGRDQRLRHRAPRRPVGGRAADREDQPRRRARRSTSPCPTTPGSPGSTPSSRPTSGPCSATSSTTPSTPRPPPAAARVDVHLRTEDDGTVLVRVADTGPRRTRAAGRRDLPSRLVDQAERRQSAGVSDWRWCSWSASVARGRCRSTTTTAPCSPHDSRTREDRP